LLKTLEEPPAHVKFLFATTEAEKLPVTVLSRCQRFDLRRIPTEMLAAHFARVCEAEQVEVETEALAMIAIAAEGSVRDGLSILDQAIAHADLEESARVTAEQVRDMLGLADRTLQRRLFAALLAGDGGALLELVAQQFSLGIEPAALMRGAMDLAHRVTVAQIGQKSGGGALDAASAEEREAIEGWARELTAAQLHRLWQLLLKGYDEVRQAPDPLVAAQMALLRVMHAADLPDPGSLVKRLESLAANPAGPAAPNSSEAPPADGGGAGLSWKDLVESIERRGNIHLATMLRMQVRVVELRPGVLRYAQAPGFNDDFAVELRKALEAVTATPWMVEREKQGGEPSLVEQDEARQAAADADRRSHPLVEAALAAFPDAEFVTEADQPRAFGNRTWNR
jgi:DNA polymerase-3 subunit gamma/tau